MKKKLLLTTIVLMLPMWIFAQTYSSLWKQVKDAEDRDLPKTEQELLTKIAQKAEKERAYGQLLKAEVQHARSLSSVSPDSLPTAVGRLKQREAQAAGNVVLQAVYDAVLGYIYNHVDIDTDEETVDGLDLIKNPAERRRHLARYYYDRALAHPKELAKTKAASYEPFVVEGTDSRLYNNDLLSVIGYEAERFDLLSQYYSAAGKRTAALLSTLELLKRQTPDGLEALNKSGHLQRLDSLIREYGDLTECGEAAIARYEFMDTHTDATAEQKWQYINYALDRWGAWQRMNALRNSQRDLTAHNFSAEFEELNIPNRPLDVKVRQLRGISTLTVRVYSVKAQGNDNLYPYGEGYRRLKPLLTALPHLTQTRTYVGHQPYEQFDDSLTIEGLPAGIYLIEMESSPQTDVARHIYYVSDVRVLSQPLPDKQTRYVVVNATTGQPIKGATIQAGVYRNAREMTVLSRLTTNAEGEAMSRWTNERPTHAFAYTADDKACPTLFNDSYYNYRPGRELVSNTRIYTDRSIYRPGQTVHAAAICFVTRNGYQNEVEAGKQVRLVLRDANYQVVAEQTVVTDDYGTCSADFTLPRQSLNGTFSVVADNARCYFHVEEYKRPAFEVDMPAVSRSYADGDTVVVSGKARSYAGVPVQGAHVKYKVERRLAFWWFSYSRYWQMGVLGHDTDNEELCSGETVTGSDGSFTVDVPIILPKTDRPMFYNFVVTAHVTDQAGETHDGQLSLPMGNRPTAFTSTIPEKVLAEAGTKVSFHQQNAAGVDLEANVRYRIDRGKWLEVKTNTLFTLPKLSSGEHTLEAICAQDSLTERFTVFSLDDTRPATQTDDWFFASDSNFPNDGTPVTVQVGSSAKDVHIVYSVLAENKVVENGFADRSNELLNRKFDYRDDYGNGLLLTYAWYKEGKLYRHTATIRRPLPDKNLKLTWKTFRNRLTPGQQEEWTLTVTPPTPPANGQAAAEAQPFAAQLMATLYDKSLDQLYGHSWSLSPYINLPLPYTTWNAIARGLANCSGYKHQGLLNVSALELSTFDHDVYPSLIFARPMMVGAALGSGIRVRGTRLMKSAMNSAAYETAEVEEAAVMMDDMAPATMEAKQRVVPTDEEAAADDNDAATREQAVQVRENLQETAFFYPQLTTNADGEVALRFTLPESLTTWRFMAVAHTPDMMYGSFSDEAVASKDVMIQPNMPRFLRQGDKATIAARIANMSDRKLTGTARLLLIDPETEQTVAQSAQTVTVAPDSTVGVSFGCHPLSSWPALLIAKVTVSGQDFSDGEQHYLPILPDAEHVTVTVPFTQIAPGTKEIDLAALFPKADSQQQPTAQPARLTVEYTNNPVWLMIQALPAIGHPHDNCAICQAASLYANTIGRHIISQNPQAKTVFEQWSREDTPLTSLDSQLEKNEELKDLVLNETPWVIEAKDETEQKHRLADFFDQNLMQQRIAAAVSQLQALQLGDGSWTWWPGMPGSWYMTVQISETLVRLNLMTATADKQRKLMLDESFRYMGRHIVRMVEEMKREEKKGVKQAFPSRTALQWLYVCALDGRELSASVKSANDYLIGLLKKDIKNQTIYEKALTAIILNSQDYIKSLKEFTVYREDMGRYYDTQRAGYSWRDYRIPTQVAAIEAIKRLTPADTVTITEMQRWLLQQKRTQAWDTPINSVDAVYAFLNDNQQALKPQPKTVLAIDGKPLDNSEATAGLGYVKQAFSYDAGETPHKFTAQKTSTGTSWGAVYAQFMQHTADIADQASGITVRREIFTADQTPLDAARATLKVGDRVTVRLTITADRDYDFVQVIDRRAACLEPVNQLSGYHWGYYCSPKDYTTNFYFDRLAKGKHVIENEYYIDRAGTYETGTCTAGCAYSPEFRGMTHSQTISVVGQ